MNYSSIPMIATYFQWAIGLGISIITIRIIRIIHKGSTSLEEHVSIRTVLPKVLNHIGALVIAVLLEAIIEFIKSYLFQYGA